MEDLDVNNILEIAEIRKMISHKKHLVDMFDEILKKVNVKINAEKMVKSIKDEDIPNDMLLESDEEED